MKKEKTESFAFNSKKIPTASGCYLFWDENENLLYVGKAKNIRKRVASYFQKKNSSPRIDIMVSKIARIEPRVVNSEMEALIMENNLIKEFQPRFNVRLRDDKNFVYLRITNENFPKMEITRRIIRDGSIYIGPKTSVKEFRETVRFCQKFFRVRMTRSSLDYYPHVAAGGFEDDPAEYQKNVDLMIEFLKGKTKPVLQNLQQKMHRFAGEKNFEAAARMRDLIQSVEKSTESQTVQLTDPVNRDFVHFVRDERNAYCVRIAFREGKLLNQNEVVLAAEKDIPDEEVLEGFLMQFYEKVYDAPDEIYLPLKPEDREKIQEFLSSEIFPEHSVKIFVPQRGVKKEVLLIAQKNAKNFAERKKIEALSHAENFSKALPELSEALDLKNSPRRIECFDISHFSGEATVASQVVFIDGEPKKSEYRRFRIKTLEKGKIDDFAAMKEVLSRRFARKDDKRFAEKFPDLIVIDGGKGQLSSVLKGVEEAKKEKIFPRKFSPKKQIIALAKREEQIFRPEKKEPLELPYDSAALKLLQRIRDEAHRFAIGFNRSTRKKQATQSILDTIPGIGNTTRKKLIQKFGSIAGVKQATEKQLREILNEKQFKNLKKNI